MPAAALGLRIKILREQQRLTQDELARAFGFKDRQTVSAIENGERRVSADELLTAMKVLKAPIDFFIDPFRLMGEGQFSWRQSGVRHDDLQAYEQGAGKFIAAFRELSPQVGRDARWLRWTLPLNRHSTYEDAMAAGERIAAELDLGDVPSASLADAMERELGILVLMVDPISGVSGAACRLLELDVVLINRNEVAGRRNFDLAHELFHILTWEAMPPEHVEEAAETGGNRVEQLANNFASALLMPGRVVDRFADWRALGDDALGAELRRTAEALGVTASALKWRLVSLGRISRARALGILDAALHNNGHPAQRVEQPALFSRGFAEVIAKAADEGRISLRKLADLMDVAVDDIAGICASHGVEAPYAL
ncbi:XRE family transcriptional regulator [Mesorhizobium sp. RP14(2022)]|uniref:XRE family transcriptional regulator n=1 Tax=Mesorhizobium liriopis TaxID=2953882 RepID=A0ABT1C2I6_9HYPH|nr:XRE family transcriptional regulator [Mesorhizobium liriopis]MCO6048376.1 XRE family transcriptional regulator [Mesorhizobium liriopis]